MSKLEVTSLLELEENPGSRMTSLQTVIEDGNFRSAGLGTLSESEV